MAYKKRVHGIHENPKPLLNDCRGKNEHYPLTQAAMGQYPKLHAKLQRPSSKPTPLPSTHAGGVNGETVGVAIGNPETVPH